MASKSIYIYELPFKPRRELCRILDADRRWEELGGEHMKLDSITLTLIGQAVLRNGSPTEELLNRWSERNGTVLELFAKLAKMDHQRGMTILLPYVDEKYHKYVRDKSAFSGLLTRESEHHFSCSSNFPHNTSHQGGAAATNLADFKFSDDSANINNALSTLTIKPKMNSLNHQQDEGRQKTPRKSPDRRNVKAEAANCVESVTDNCVSEKIKNVRKLSQPNQLDPSNMKMQGKLTVDMLTIESSLPDVMKISYEEIKRATDNFDISRILGRGGFGAVYRGDWKGISVAIKRLMPKESHDSVSQHMISLKQSLNEMNILNSCHFDHILSLYGVSLDGIEPCLIYQLMVNGSLEDRLLCRKNTPPLTWLQRSHIAECTAKGLNYLHTTPGKPLVHGDIKSANILLDKNMDAKIGDFGLAREGPGCQDTHVKVSKLRGTECYLPPEYLRHRQLSPQVDVYCYGVVLQEMATGLRPFDEKRNDAKRLIDYVIDCQGSGRLDMLRDLKAGEENMLWFLELIRISQECSQREKKKRATMQQVLQCFTKIREDETIMNMKARKLSNEQNGLVDISKLKELSPRGRQMYYELRKEKYGVAGIANVGMESSNASASLANENTCFPPAAAVLSHQVTAEFSAAKCQSSVEENKPEALAVPVDVQSASPGNFNCPGTSTNPSKSCKSDDQAFNVNVPIPLLSVFQLQGDEEQSYSQFSTQLTTSRIDDDDSCCTEYSEDSVLQ